MPDRDRNMVTQRVALRDGQINLNGTVLDVNGITFTQDGIETARIDRDTLYRLDNDAEFTATATVSDYDAFEQAMRRRMIDRFSEIPLTNAATAQDVRIGIDRAQHQGSYVARMMAKNIFREYLHTYKFDNPWGSYNPYMCAVAVEDEEPELDEKNDKLDGFLLEFVKEAV